MNNMPTAKKKYVTLKDGGCDFRKMAKIMTDAGYKMNHATARNQLILAIESLVSHASNNLKVKIGKKDIQNLITSQILQNNLADVLYVAYQALQIDEQAEQEKKPRSKGKNGKSKKRLSQ